jgi:hypothetical protein
MSKSLVAASKWDLAFKKCGQVSAKNLEPIGVFFLGLYLAIAEDITLRGVNGSGSDQKSGGHAGFQRLPFIRNTPIYERALVEYPLAWSKFETVS